MKYLLEKRVAVDKLPLVGILQLVRLDVLPQGRDNDGTGLRVHPEQAGQTVVQLELQRLVVKQQQDGAVHVLVSRPFHLKQVI